MAINALTGRDDTLFGTAAGGAAATRLYPQWMRDAAQRGIGVAQSFTPTVPGFIEVPRGPLTGPTEMLQVGGGGGGQTVPGDVVSPYTGAEGAGAVGGMNTGVSNQPAPAGLSDILGALGLSTGQFGGPASSNIDNGAKAMSPDMMNNLGDYGGGAGGDVGGKGDMDNGAKGGDTGAMNGLYRGGIVTRNKLHGPNPAGPDDGYVAMDKGEGVLTAKAIKHYGADIVRRLNKLQVPKEAFSKR